MVKITKNEIIEFLKTHKQELQKQFGVTKIGVFGSCIRDAQKDDSDIDIAVELQEENKADNFFRLLHFLEDSFHRKVDLGIESSIKPAIKKYLEKEIIYV